MPHLFALQGPGNCGKSETLMHVYRMLRAKYPAASVQWLHSDPKDIAAIVRIGESGPIVGIESHGDPNSRLQQSLSAFRTAKCDTIFCACRTRGMTIAWISSMSASYTINIIAQTRVSGDYESANATTAASLIGLAGI
jgi:hypothetical protein